MGGPRCMICVHEARYDIDRAIVSGKYSNRVISRRFGVSADAVQRHRVKHLPKYLALTARARELVDREKTLGEIEGMVHEVKMLFAACHDYLLDPDDPGRYFLGPRAEDILVSYTERKKNGDGKEHVAQRKAQLSALLEKTGVEVDHSRYKIADPRRLILEAAGRLESILETVANIAGFIPKQQGSLQVQVNVLQDPAWLKIQEAIISALQAFPEARATVVTALADLRSENAGDG